MTGRAHGTGPVAEAEADADARAAGAVEVLGRDVALEAYRVRITADGAPLTGYVPEALFANPWRPGERPSHQDAYEWIAGNRGRIRAALIARARGAARIRAPFDQLFLAEEV